MRLMVSRLTALRLASWRALATPTAVPARLLGGCFERISSALRAALATLAGGLYDGMYIPVILAIHLLIIRVQPFRTLSAPVLGALAGCFPGKTAIH